jgi:hypothetical protein
MISNDANNKNKVKKVNLSKNFEVSINFARYIASTTFLSKLVFI